MRERRTLVVLGLALLHLALAATVTLETADVAWAPSYFDGDDGDTAPLPLSERLPALAGAAGGMIPLLAALAVPARVRSRARPLPRSTPRVASSPRAVAGGFPPASCSNLHPRGGYTCSVWVLRS